MTAAAVLRNDDMTAASCKSFKIFIDHPWKCKESNHALSSKEGIPPKFEMPDVDGRTQCAGQSCVPGIANLRKEALARIHLQVRQNSKTALLRGMKETMPCSCLEHSQSCAPFLELKCMHMDFT